MILAPLKPEDIEEKIRLNNEDHGYDHITLREHLRKELLDCQWTALRCQIEAQSLSEQIDYITKKLKQARPQDERT